MTDSYLEQAEQDEIFRQKVKDNSGILFRADGSAGNNPLKLAQILCVFDFTMNVLGWSDKPLANLSRFLTQYQASLDAKYHNDYKDVLISEEIERKRADRKGLSITHQ